MGNSNQKVLEPFDLNQKQADGKPQPDVNRVNVGWTKYQFRHNPQEYNTDVYSDDSDRCLYYVTEPKDENIGTWRLCKELRYSNPQSKMYREGGYQPSEK